MEEGEEGGVKRGGEGGRERRESGREGKWQREGQGIGEKGKG